MNTVAQANNRPELSYTNPFHWAKAFVGLLGFSAGYAPLAAKTIKEQTHTWKLEAELELINSGQESKVSFKQEKAIGRKISHQHYDKVLADIITSKVKAVEALEVARKA